MPCRRRTESEARVRTGRAPSSDSNVGAGIFARAEVVGEDMKKTQIALGIALGAGLGTAVGVVAGNIGLWLGLGIAIGILIGNRSGRNACAECASAHAGHVTPDETTLARPDRRGRLSPHVHG
jgi:hypothetical protein